MSRRTRGNGEGSVFQRRDNKGKEIGWRGQQYIGSQRKSYSGKTKQEVLDKMDADRVDFRRGSYVADDDTTVGEWAEYWLERRKKPSVKEQTYNHLWSHLHNYILPYLGDVKLQDLTQELIQETYYKVFVYGTKENGMPFADGTIKQTATCFKSCLQDAVRAKKLITNPHDEVIRPRGLAPKKVYAYSPEDQEKIVEFCKCSTKRSDWLFYFLIATGLRVGEAVCLTWDDVDLRNRTVTINKTLIYVRGTAIVQEEPKTSKGNRTIIIPNNVVKFLKQKKQEIDPEQNVKNLVFPNMRYTYMKVPNLRVRFQKVCAILDIEYHDGLHSLRHTWATRCLERNVPIKVVSEMLGHEKVEFTMNVYQDVLKESQVGVAEILDDLF